MYVCCTEFETVQLPPFKLTTEYSMQSLLVRKNTTIVTKKGKAELFFQTKFADHILGNYQADLTKKTQTKRHHDLKFSDIAHLLRGNVSLEPLDADETKWEAVSFCRGRYHLTLFHLGQRDDSATLFAFVVTSYATFEKHYHDRYQAYLEAIRQRYPPR